MAQPGILSTQLPKSEDWIPREIADLKREMRELGPSIMHSFQGIVDELAAHQATLDAQQATLTTTVSELSAAVADIATNLASINTLITQVVAPGLVWASATNFALSTTFATLLTSTITVPPGFTQCIVSMDSRVYSINPNTTGGTDGTGGDWLYTRTNIAGYYPAAFPILVGGSRHFAISVDPLSQLASGLTPGTTFNITVEAKSTNLAWAADVNNTVELAGSLQWFR